jgi:threonylcarbamoyladenosine tRNA methylthiotransferase MtaB
MPSVYVKTLGCKVNTYDTHAIETQFKALGYELVDSPDAAQISVLNTCSVTENADKEARYLLRKFRRENPDAVVVATGCYAQTDSQKLVEMDEVDLVFPNQSKDLMVQSAHTFLQNRSLGLGSEPGSKLPQDVQAVSENRQGHFKSSLTLFEADPSQTRAFLKIQDGCNGFCSYCLIPYARGASRSVASQDVKREVRRLIDKGIQEIVFAGIHIGDYGVDHGDEEGFVNLFRELMSWPDMVRVRISSLEPRECTESLLKVLRERPELFCDHFHLPLQSGHDRILKLMRRTYDTQKYAENVAMARSYFPDANFGADVIPGFPSETDEEFEATLRFIESCGINYLHVFPYSKRPNTAAAKMPGHLPADIVKERAKRLRELSEQLKAAYSRRYIGTDTRVLWENEKDGSGRQVGHSPHYLQVCAPKDAKIQPGTVSLVRLKGFVEDGRLLGKILH